jgi:hypothetical protein
LGAIAEGFRHLGYGTTLKSTSGVIVYDALYAYATDGTAWKSKGPLNSVFRVYLILHRFDSNDKHNDSIERVFDSLRNLEEKVNAG